jgi:nitrate/nitrite transporter NarK
LPIEVYRLALPCLALAQLLEVFVDGGPAHFSGLAIASGTAAINSIGQLSGIVAPIMVGKINDVTGSTYMGMLSIAPLILLACCVVMRYVKNPKP